MQRLDRIANDYLEMLATGDVEAWLPSQPADAGTLVAFYAAAKEVCPPVLFEALIIRSSAHETHNRLNAQRRRKQLPELSFSFGHVEYIGVTDA